MSSRTFFLSGIGMIIGAIIITILFDVQPYISLTIFSIGAGIVGIVISRFLLGRDVENFQEIENETSM
ncbi:MAG: hypothetical protein PW786_15560 [Arachidicoccus sp.]|nr:hypothetical protein [Arachidicoccus sp.]